MFAFANNVHFKKKCCQYVDRIGLVQETLARNASLCQFVYSALRILEGLTRQSCISDFFSVV